jgi:DNA-binding transcriptional ArsR family regulator
VDSVFRALADPTRRSLLDALFVADGLTVQQLSALFPAMTRFGVMKHLQVLEAANLVTTRREGRLKRHFLNPVPIQQISDRWLSKYARTFTAAMTDLQRTLETPQESA